MTSQVIFKIDKKLKEKAMKKAKQEGIAFSYFLKMATQAYVDDAANIQFVAEPKLNYQTKKEIETALKDIKAGKNIVGPFNSVEEMKNYLMSK